MMPKYIKPRAFLVLGIIAFNIAMLQQSIAGSEKGPPHELTTDGFITLFNGRDLAGWKGLPDYWSVVEGAISGHETKENSKQTFLVYEGVKVRDFELHLKYRFASPTGNSGVQFRSIVLDESSFRVGGYQADFDADARFDGSIYDESGIAGDRGTMSNRGERTIWDTENKRHSTPLNINGSDLERAIRRGDWNEVVLVARGDTIVYTINDHIMTELIDHSSSALREGVLALQLHQGFTMDVRFTDVRLKILNQ